jgi:hypothetical protein
LFNVIKGKISAYSFLSETSGVNSFYLWQLQIDGGAMQQFDPQLLEPLVKNDAKAYKAFLKKDYYKAILLYNTSR